MARTDNLNNYLTDVASAIKEKKGDSTPISASNFDEEIRNLPSGGGGDLSEYFNDKMANGSWGDGSSWVKLIKKIPPVEITSTSCDYTFQGCLLEILPELYSNVKITSVYNMFYGAKNIKEINVNNLDLSKTTTFQQMCTSCTKLEKFILNKHTVSDNTIRITQLFSSCSKLKEVDLSGLEANVNNSQSMFDYNEGQLQKLDIRRLDFLSASVSNMFGSNNTRGVPDNCLIIVKDQANKEYLMEQHPRMTNIKTVEEYEAM